MERKYIQRNSRLPICVVIFLFFSELLASCANGQGHLASQQWLDAERGIENTAVLLNNEAKQVPVIQLETLRFASVELGFGYSATFDSLANKYVHITPFSASYYLASGSLNGLSAALDPYNIVLIQVTDPALSDPKIVDFIQQTAQKKQVILAYFGNGTRLSMLDQVSSPLIWCKPVNAQSASFAAQAIFGGVEIKALTDAKYSEKILAGSGFQTSRIRLKYTVPEEVGVNTDDLAKIDDIAAEAIRERATPGAVVLVAKDGKVIFNKAYGSFTYEMQRMDRVTDIFDLASCTKISATTPAVMKLFDEGRISLDNPLSTYLPATRNTPKQNILVKEVMLHQAGFTPYIPFFEKLRPIDHSSDSSAAYPTKVADGYYLRKDYYKDVMWPQMLSSKLVTRGQYVYSDLSMYFMKEIVEGITGTPLDKYAQQSFYEPLGMQTAGYNPRNRFPRDQIVPTEDDSYFRNTLLQGYVHDQGAAMAGGVSGHAGVFASTNDLAILFQMMLNRGSYGGRQYLKPETVDLFTARQSTVSRRGYGFDRWDPETTKHYPSESASPATYGHTGYTGTCIWVDPASKLVYIFLSNRVYPKVTDKLSHLSIRPRIQEVIYDALRKAGPPASY